MTSRPSIMPTPAGYIRAGEKLMQEMRQEQPPVTRRPPRLVDPLDMATIRHAATHWDVLALVIVGLAVAAVPVILFLFGELEDKR